MFIVGQRVKPTKLALDGMPKSQREVYEGKVAEVVETFPPEHVVVVWPSMTVVDQEYPEHSIWINVRDLEEEFAPEQPKHTWGVPRTSGIRR